MKMASFTIKDESSSATVEEIQLLIFYIHIFQFFRVYSISNGGDGNNFREEMQLLVFNIHIFQFFRVYRISNGGDKIDGDGDGDNFREEEAGVRESGNTKIDGDDDGDNFREEEAGEGERGNTKTWFNSGDGDGNNFRKAEAGEANVADELLFKAQPVLTEDPIPVPEKVRKPLTEVQDFKLRVDNRSLDRAEFDKKIKQKEMMHKRYIEETESARMIEEEKALKQLRRTLVPHARPVPKFDHPFLPQKSCKQVTKPRSPNLLIVKRKERKATAACPYAAVSTAASQMRQNPVKGMSGILKVVEPGYLVLINDVTNDTVWLTNSSTSVKNPVAKLLDTGNLVVKDVNDDDEYLWQSFDYPSDTLLASMKLGRNLVTGLERYCPLRPDRLGYLRLFGPYGFGTGLERNCQFREAVNLYGELQRCGLSPSTFAVSSALKACARIPYRSGGILIHAQVYKYGFCNAVHVQTALVDFYSKVGNMDFAQSVFDEMVEKNIVSWNSVLGGYVKSGDLKMAQSVFDEMPEKDVISWNCMVAGMRGWGI
ncbi:Protein TPX2 [Capsicum baccatum]|uniref:Protein TPX2 n=1 Tax=Capsicum baccatum TaxID=33114 RepID=A0A2G2V362_CAPBA|nr:Protein TPX2 [Capsicum baccatum]